VRTRQWLNEKKRKETLETRKKEDKGMAAKKCFGKRKQKSGECEDNNRNK
jgi:hypothetical protein